jgi:hypothetical protein
MLPWYFSEEAAARKYMSQLQHNMWVVAARSAVLSVITGGGKWVEIKVHADPLHQHLIMTTEVLALRGKWRTPSPVRSRAAKTTDRRNTRCRHDILECVGRIRVIFIRTKAAHGEHEQAKAELKKLVPEDAQQAIGHGVRARRSKLDTISFDLLKMEANHAPIQ